MKRLLYALLLIAPLPFSTIDLFPVHTSHSLENCFFQHDLSDSLATTTHFFPNDSLQRNINNVDLKLNEDAIKLIHFDFTSTGNQHEMKFESAPIKKPWMDFQVDLSVPKNLIDTTKVRKPEGYIRLLPYSIWTLFGKDPIYDVLVFGNKKRLEFMFNLDVDYVEEYGRNLMPQAGRYNPNQTVGSASVVIGNLDFIGFFYNNLNKHGRLLKHNRKHANAWKTYNKVAPMLSEDLYAAMPDSAKHEKEDYYHVGQPGLYHNLKSVELTEEKSKKYFERPDYRLLQTTEQRSRFGTFYDPDLYALPSENGAERTDSMLLNKENAENEQEKSRYQNEQTLNKKSKKRRANHKTKESKRNKQNENDLKELPNSMEDLYKYIRAKQVEDSIKRKLNSRKDKVENNVYELEQQQRRLRELQN